MPTISSRTAINDRRIANEGTAGTRRREELLSTEVLRRALFDNALLCCIVVDASGLIQQFSVGAERMLGHRASAVLRRLNGIDLCDPAQLRARARTLSEEYGRTVATGFDAFSYKALRNIEDRYDMHLIDALGARVAVTATVTALRDAQDEVVGYLLVASNNSERTSAAEAQVQREQQLREQLFHARTLLDASDNALLTTDLSGFVTDANRAMRTLTGRSRNELTGAHCKYMFADPLALAHTVKRVLTEQIDVGFEAMLLDCNGGQTPVACRASLLRDRAQLRQGLVLTLTDLSAQQQTERALRDARQALAQAQRAHSDMADLASAQLQAALSDIVGMAEQWRSAAAPASARISDVQIEHMCATGRRALALLRLDGDGPSQRAGAGT